MASQKVWEERVRDNPRMTSAKKGWNYISTLEDGRSGIMGASAGKTRKEIKKAPIP